MPLDRTEIFPGTKLWYLETECDYPYPKQREVVALKEYGQNSVILDDGKLHDMRQLFDGVDREFCRYWEHAIEDKMNNLSELLKYVRQRWKE